MLSTTGLIYSLPTCPSFEFLGVDNSNSNVHTENRDVFFKMPTTKHIAYFVVNSKLRHRLYCVAGKYFES
jgi:hypothetical protein